MNTRYNNRLYYDCLNSGNLAQISTQSVHPQTAATKLGSNEKLKGFDVMCRSPLSSGTGGAGEAGRSWSASVSDSTLHFLVVPVLVVITIA